MAQATVDLDSRSLMGDHTADAHQANLAPFRELNALEQETGQKVSWRDRVRLIKQHFPSIDRLDWDRAFRQDPAIMVRIREEILKYDLAPTGRSGPRPGVDPREAATRWRQLMGEDFSFLAFPEALRALKGERSVRHFASRVGLPRSTINSYLQGEINPSLPAMEQIASSFDKDPSYFWEYRVAYVSAQVMAGLERSPEASIVAFQKFSEVDEDYT